MRTVLKTTLLFALVSGLALAESYTGKLIDATCAAQKGKDCTPTASTTSFALEASGKVLRFDAAGNNKATAALKEHDSSANRSKDPSAGSAGVNATVSGTASGDQLKVDAIQVE